MIEIIVYVLDITFADALKKLQQATIRDEQAKTLQEMVDTLNEQKLSSAEQLESIKRDSGEKVLKLQGHIEELSNKLDEKDSHCQSLQR